MGDWGYRYKMSMPEHFWLIVFAIVVLGGVVAVAALESRQRYQRTAERSFNLEDTPAPTLPPAATAAASRTPRPAPSATPGATATLTAGEVSVRISALIQQAQEPWDKHDWPQAINILVAARALMIRTRPIIRSTKTTTNNRCTTETQ